MFVGGLRAAAVAAVAVPMFAVGAPAPIASADPGVLVYPGMEIHQGTTRCTLGYVDPVARTGYTAGHCRVRHGRRHSHRGDSRAGGCW